MFNEKRIETNDRFEIESSRKRRFINKRCCFSFILFVKKFIKMFFVGKERHVCWKKPIRHRRHPISVKESKSNLRRVIVVVQCSKSIVTFSL